MRRGVQGPLEVGPGRLARLQQVRGRGLAVPAPAQVGELPEQGLPVVPVQLHVGEVREVPVPGWLHGVQGAEDGQGEGCVGQGVLAAPHHVHAVADAVGIALRQLADQRRRARALHVGLVDAAAHAALQARGAGGLQERLGPVALQAEGLQHLGLALQGLVHGALGQQRGADAAQRRSSAQKWPDSTRPAQGRHSEKGGTVVSFRSPR